MMYYNNCEFVQLETLRQKFEDNFHNSTSHKNLKWNPIYSDVVLAYNNNSSSPNVHWSISNFLYFSYRVINRWKFNCVSYKLVLCFCSIDLTPLLYPKFENESILVLFVWGSFVWLICYYLLAHDYYFNKALSTLLNFNNGYSLLEITNDGPQVPIGFFYRIVRHSDF